MFKRKISESDVLLITINLVPLWGVWFARWSPAELFIVYCLECVLIGFFNLLKLGLVTGIKKEEE